MLEKVCSRCDEIKPIEKFGRRKQSKDGYYGLCKLCRNSDTKKSKENKNYTDNEKLLEKERKRNYYINNKQDILKKCKEYRDNNKQYTKEYKKIYYSKNRIDLIKYSSDYHTNRIKNDPLYKFSCNVRNLIKNSIKSKGCKKNTRTEQILGIDILSFLEYIESKFEPWMNWDNYGDFDGNIGKEFNYSWSIDHKIPICTAKNEEDIILLNHYTNLQPLCSKINMCIKRDRLDYK